jgi:hypothetical protein
LFSKKFSLSGVSGLLACTLRRVLAQVSWRQKVVPAVQSHHPAERFEKNISLEKRKFVSKAFLKHYSNKNTLSNGMVAIHAQIPRFNF